MRMRMPVILGMRWTALGLMQRQTPTLLATGMGMNLMVSLRKRAGLASRTLRGRAALQQSASTLPRRRSSGERGGCRPEQHHTRPMGATSLGTLTAPPTPATLATRRGSTWRPQRSSGARAACRPAAALGDRTGSPARPARPWTGRNSQAPLQPGARPRLRRLR